MRSIIFLLLAASVWAQNNAQALLIARPQSTGGGSNTFTLIQHKDFDNSGSGTGGGTCATSGTSCQVTTSSTGTSNIIIVWTITGNNTTVNSPSASTSQGTWTHCASCNVFDGAAGHADAWYVLASTSGATSVTCNTNTADGAYLGCWAGEYSCSPGPCTVDNSNTATNASCSTCAAPSLSITGTKDLFVQAIVPGSNATAINGAYTNPADFPGGNFGVAGAINQTTYSAPNWTTGGAASVMAVLAIK